MREDTGLERQFHRALNRMIRRQPGARAKVESTLRQLERDPFHPSLHSHKLKGQLASAWACTVDYGNHILFEFDANPDSGEDEILLLTIGTHDEVYWDVGSPRLRRDDMVGGLAG